MTPSTRPRIGITIGDPGGIGPEVALKAIAAWGDTPPADIFLIGPGGLWGIHTNALKAAQPELAPAIEAALACAVVLGSDDPARGQQPVWGRTNARHGAIAEAAIRKAVALCQEGHLDAICTAPISKEGLHACGSPFPGHTEMLQHLTGSPTVGMMLAGGGLRVGLVTIHVALRRVFDLVTPEKILEQAGLMHEFLTRWLGDAPRIGVCGLNPHAGEGGMFGTEEADILAPAIEEAGRRGMALDGPHPADTIFKDALEGRFDAVLAMYHDQGLIPIKTLAFDKGVNMTMGIPLIRTSPDHGTAFGIAGRGIARPGSMTAALEAAIELAGKRTTSHA